MNTQSSAAQHKNIQILSSAEGVNYDELTEQTVSERLPSQTLGFEEAALAGQFSKVEGAAVAAEPHMKIAEFKTQM